MPGFFGELGAMDEALCDYILMLRLGEWSAPWRMVPATTWDSAGMFACPSAIHPGCGYFGFLHDAAVLEGSPIGFLDGKHTEGIPLLQYADDTTFFIQGSETAARTLSMMMDVFTDLSGLQLNRAKSTVVDFSLSAKELSRCVEILAYTNRDTTSPILGSAVNRPSPSNTRLAADNGKGRITAGRMAGETAFRGRSPCSGEDSPFCPPDVLHVCISDARRAAAAT